MISNTELASKYLKVMKNIDVSYLDLLHPDTKCGSNMLSGLFLPSIPDGYEQSQNKIMIIGRETRAWNVLKADEKFVSLDAYIEKAMATHTNHSYKELNKDKKSRGQSYFNFFRKIKNKSGGSGLIHANLFCFSWNKKGLDNCPHLKVVKEYSEVLLKTQIEYFKPDIIIFAHGSGGNKFRREIFPTTGDGNVCLPPLKPITHLPSDKDFWEFSLNGKYKSYRVAHPSSTTTLSRQAHDYLISILPPS